MTAFQIKVQTTVQQFWLKILNGYWTKMAPYKRLSNKEMGLKQRPWINHDILKIMRDRDDIHKQYVKEKDLIRKDILFRIYKSIRNTVLKNIRQSKNLYYSDFFEKTKIILKNMGRDS